MAQSFPTTVPTYADTQGSEVLGSAGSGLGLSRILDDYGLDLAAVCTKVGTGNDNPAANTFLVGNGAGSSEWTALTSAELAARISDETGSGALVFATSPVFATSVDLNAAELILDADGDTTITADTDDQIDIKIAGADDFQFTANTFNALSGSDIQKAGVSVPSISETATLTNKTINADNNTISGIGQAEVDDGVVVQKVYTNYATAATGSTAIPLDDTVPQNTEGDQYMSQAITPKSTTNILEIECLWYGASSATASVILALFQDTTAGALAASAVVIPTANYRCTIALRHTMVAGTVASTTFKLRAGNNAGATLTFNGSSGSREFGAITKSSITVTEYKAS